MNGLRISARSEAHQVGLRTGQPDCARDLIPALSMIATWLAMMPLAWSRFDAMLAGRIQAHRPPALPYPVPRDRHLIRVRHSASRCLGWALEGRDIEVAELHRSRTYRRSARTSPDEIVDDRFVKR